MIAAEHPEEEILSLLSNGELEVIEVMPKASNFTFLARVRRDGREAAAVYKPRSGEAPLWDFPSGTLCNREVAAYLVARSLGWPGVPPTVMRDGPRGPGSVQLFVEFDPNEHFFTLRERFEEEFRKIAAFDAVVNNADRKGGHCLLGRDGRVYVIDHGVCFNTSPKLRTVVWDFAGERMPDAITADLRRLPEDLLHGGLGQKLIPLLEPAELESLAGRAEALAANGLFPRPGPGRPYPWPMI